MIVLKKDGNTTAPLKDFAEAQKLVNEGYEVWINKTGKKLEPKKAEKKSKAKKVEKVEEE